MSEAGRCRPIDSIGLRESPTVKLPEGRWRQTSSLEVGSSEKRRIPDLTSTPKGGRWSLDQFWKELIYGGVFFAFFKKFHNSMGSHDLYFHTSSFLLR
ncbi:hypothetical protein TNCV_4567641 [Trichonephila clavipes]|nr:hypothetical protein TNCV_4567641 [Trichonephila clavipes]